MAVADTSQIHAFLDLWLEAQQKAATALQGLHSTLHGLRKRPYDLNVYLKHSVAKAISKAVKTLQQGGPLGTAPVPQGLASPVAPPGHDTASPPAPAAEGAAAVAAAAGPSAPAASAGAGPGPGAGAGTAALTRESVQAAFRRTMEDIKSLNSNNMKNTEDKSLEEAAKACRAQSRAQLPRASTAPGPASPASATAPAAPAAAPAPAAAAAAPAAAAPAAAAADAEQQPQDAEHAHANTNAQGQGQGQTCLVTGFVSTGNPLRDKTIRMLSAALTAKHKELHPVQAAVEIEAQLVEHWGDAGPAGVTDAYDRQAAALWVFLSHDSPLRKAEIVRMVLDGELSPADLVSYDYRKLAVGEEGQKGEEGKEG